MWRQGSNRRDPVARSAAVAIVLLAERIAPAHPVEMIVHLRRIESGQY